MPASKHAQQNHAGEDDEDTARIEGAHHDQDGQEWQHHIDFGHALDQLIDPAAEPRTHPGDDQLRQGSAHCRQQPEGQRNGRAPQQGNQQVAAQMVGASPTRQLAVHHQFHIHVRRRVKGDHFHFERVLAFDGAGAGLFLRIGEQADIGDFAAQLALDLIILAGAEAEFFSSEKLPRRISSPAGLVQVSPAKGAFSAKLEVKKTMTSSGKPSAAYSKGKVKVMVLLSPDSSTRVTSSSSG
jgi:hypothetical protein